MLRYLTISLILSCLFYTGLSFSDAKNNAKFASRTDRLNHHLAGLNASLQTRKSLVTVILETDKVSSNIRQMVESRGSRIRYQSGRKTEIRMAADKLVSLIAQLPDGVHARLPYPHQAVAVTSQGVALTGASDMQYLGSGGAGIKIGVIDLGFASYTSAQASGDLPSGLSITDYTGTGTGGTNHGTNVAEIVYDMAPDAELYLAKVGTILQLEQAMNDMHAAGVRIINHSVAWFGAAFYDGTGSICQITDNAEANGIQWVNAMGNSRSAHYLGNFTDLDADLRHEFSSGQNRNTISLTAGNPVTLVLNWDAYPTTNIDYNLYLYDGDPDAGGSLVASSSNRQNGNFSSYPYEAISYTPTTTASHYIVVTKDSGDSNVPLTLFSTGPSLDIRTTASSVVQPADCYSVLSVGATDLSDAAEWFSSEGPTTDGRAKPEITGPNRTLTSLTSSFTGTSGASPHVAGAAALLLSQHPEFTTSELRTSLINDSFDVYNAGFDYRTGYGRLSMDADEDGFNHDTDNCVLAVNIDQLDTDQDAAGNVCDDDDDNDGLSDMLELSIGTDSLNIDSDLDGLSDYLEVAFDGNASAYTPGEDLNPLLADSDGDSLSDFEELAWDGDAYTYLPGSDLNPLAMDTDADGIYDSTDPVPLVFNYADGDLAPLGSIDGLINIADLVIIQRLIRDDLVPTTEQLAHGDVYPAGAPDGIIDMSDLIMLRQQLLQ